ncbi:hypothetical protein BamMEX5DRAFT_0581 [Burkholderia ambifaria MEX-5]|uniref:Uncharacterized protein n=1 Tax=Burkholderia ambifaria MEX-5 TaxID=396597 RepID=B1SYG5_9BURK|nr:hypothetical protein BamMEX5DRAFT_0581 [Burkholderia ambifaria MEX-5]
MLLKRYQLYKKLLAGAAIAWRLVEPRGGTFVVRGAGAEYTPPPIWKTDLIYSPPGI